PRTRRRPLRHLRRQKLATEYPPAGARLHRRTTSAHRNASPPAQGNGTGRLRRRQPVRTRRQNRSLTLRKHPAEAAITPPLAYSAHAKTSLIAAPISSRQSGVEKR